MCNMPPNSMSANSSGRAATGALILVLIFSLCALQSRGCVHFVSSPQSATVEIGSSVSFSCVVFNSSVSHWYINNMTVRTMLKNNNYSEWDGCTREPQYCGRTLFIEYVSKELNESTISCQVLHETCDGYNATLSKPATLMVKSPDLESVSLSSSSILLHSSPTPLPKFSHTPSHTLSPSLPPPVSFDTPYLTESQQVIDGFMQRLPLVGVAASISFLVGSVFGAVCAVTLMRGCQRHHQHKLRRKISIRARPDPTYSTASERGNTDVATSEQPYSSIPLGRVEFGTEMQTNGTIPSHGAPHCNGTSAVPKAVTSIGEDLNELERVVSQQRMTEAV